MIDLILVLFGNEATFFHGYDGKAWFKQQIL